jgi:hypothetical protein
VTLAGLLIVQTLILLLILLVYELSLQTTDFRLRIKALKEKKGETLHDYREERGCSPRGLTLGITSGSHSSWNGKNHTLIPRALEGDRYR